MRYIHAVEHCLARKKLSAMTATLLLVTCQPQALCALACLGYWLGGNGPKRGVGCHCRVAAGDAGVSGSWRQKRRACGVWRPAVLRSLSQARRRALRLQGAAQQEAAGRGRRKPPQNWLERCAVLQTIAVAIAACALARLALACHADSGFVRLLSVRRVVSGLAVVPGVTRATRACSRLRACWIRPCAATAAPCKLESSMRLPCVYRLRWLRPAPVFVARPFRTARPTAACQ